MDGLDADVLDMMLQAIQEFADRHLPADLVLRLDHEDECPVELVRMMCGEDLGIHLLFVPEEYGGMGGGSFDVCRVCEKMAAIDLGVATSVLATALGSDPIAVGATEEQKKAWLGRLAAEGLLFAYGATEPEAGSDLGALKTTATPVEQDGHVVGYRLNGRKQWISNGGIADAYTVLANSPGGPSWFVVERGAENFTHGESRGQARHPARATPPRCTSTTCRSTSTRWSAASRAKGCVQAQQVFGYTRLMVAAFGLGAGWSALDRAIAYSTERIQAGGPLSEKQGYTHKLIVPHAARLEAARAYMEETAERIDAGEGEPQHRGRHRQVPGHRGRQRRRRGGHPGPRRLRLHAGVHGREDQARRPDHHDLRGHLRDHGDDDRPRPLAGAPEDPRAVLPRPGRRRGGPRTAPTPASARAPPRSPSTPSPRCWSGAAPGG